MPESVTVFLAFGLFVIPMFFGYLLSAFVYADLLVRSHVAWFGDGDVPVMQYEGVGSIYGVQ
ncbi:MAG: hypothetical protein H6737_06215 [Alphaproteobacteria bacterium]|nr:hypothetical protein [Alphaproteobacteria bacterium]